MEGAEFVLPWTMNTIASVSEYCCLLDFLNIRQACNPSPSDNTECEIQCSSTEEANCTVGSC